MSPTRFLLSMVALAEGGVSPAPASSLDRTPATAAAWTRVIVVERAGRSRPTVRRQASHAHGGGSGALVDVAGIRNGEFAADLDGWTASESGGTTAPGGIAADGGQAIISEGDSFLVTLEQTFAVPELTASLSVDVLQIPGFDLGENFIPDAFELSLLDSDALPLVSPWDPLATSSFNLQEDGNAAMGAGVSFDGTTVTVDLSAVAAGSEVTLYLDLIGADRDTAGELRIDDATLHSSIEPGTFRRGDFDGNGLVEAADGDAVLEYLFAAGAPALDCLGEVAIDPADGNDNEWITVADFLAIRGAAADAAELPPPGNTCGFDPGDAQGGFDQVDPAYVVAAGEPRVEPPAAVEDRDVLLPVLVQAPTAVTGLTLILEFDDAALTPFDPAAGDPAAFDSGAGTSRVIVDGDRLVIALWSEVAGETLLAGAPETPQEVGTLGFHLADFAVIRPFEWLGQAEVAGSVFRATVVDAQLADHHPEVVAGDARFVRGNANNDTTVDLSDPVFTLNWLFLGGPTPVCLDAADADNDSQVLITDPVYTLNFLFLGGPPIAPPHPACGFDVGEIDLLGCGGGAPCVD